MHPVTSFGLVGLLVAVLLQPSLCKPALPEPLGDGKKQDKYAKEAADALDSTLIFLKDSFANLIEDSSKIKDMFEHMSDSIKKHAPVNEESNRKTRSDHHEALRELSLIANKTFQDNNLNVD